MHKEKNVLNDYCWKSIEAKELKSGNLIEFKPRHLPRLISNVIIDDNVVTLFEKNGTHEDQFLKVTAEHKFYLLVHQSTMVPVTEGEIYEGEIYEE